MLIGELALVLVAELVPFVDAYPFERGHREDIDITIRVGCIDAPTTPSISIQPEIFRSLVTMYCCNGIAPFTYMEYEDSS